MRKFWKNESGSSATEYALILAIVGAGMGAAALALGNGVVFSVGHTANEINAINDGLSEAGSGPGGGRTDGVGGGQAPGKPDKPKK